jgi:hypothetical protein
MHAEIFTSVPNHLRETPCKMHGFNQLREPERFQGTLFMLKIATITHEDLQPTLS